MRILALDVGTSSVKAAVLDVASATPVGQIARAAYALDHPTPDAAEVPVGRLWQAVTTAARMAAANETGIEGVGLSCLMPALVLLDGRDQPLTSSWIHLDRRARPAAREVWAEVGAEFLATIGNRPLPGGITALCYRQMTGQEPTLRQQVRAYLHLNGWLVLHMTGERAFDRANACFSGLYGTLTDQTWSARWCDYFHVDPAWLPAVACGSTTVGSLRSEIAEELGVSPDLPVKIGTADTSSAVLAARQQPGDLLHVVGTTQVLATLTTQPQADPRRLTRQLGVGDSFLHVTHNPVGGVALDWLRTLCFSEVPATEFYARTIEEALHRVPTVALDPPFLGGDRLEIEPAYAAFRGLTLSCDRTELLAAVLHAMRDQHVRALDALGIGRSIQRVFLTGGGAEVVRRLLPEYSQREVCHLEEGSLRGVARLFDK